MAEESGPVDGVINYREVFALSPTVEAGADPVQRIGLAGAALLSVADSRAVKPEQARRVGSSGKPRTFGFWLPDNPEPFARVQPLQVKPGASGLSSPGDRRQLYSYAHPKSMVMFDPNAESPAAGVSAIFDFSYVVDSPDGTTPTPTVTLLDLNARIFGPGTEQGEEQDKSLHSYEGDERRRMGEVWQQYYEEPVSEFLNLLELNAVFKQTT